MLERQLYTAVNFGVGAEAGSKLELKAIGFDFGLKCETVTSNNGKKEFINPVSVLLSKEDLEKVRFGLLNPWIDATSRAGFKLKDMTSFPWKYFDANIIVYNKDAMYGIRIISEYTQEGNFKNRKTRFELHKFTGKEQAAEFRKNPSSLTMLSVMTFSPFRVANGTSYIGDDSMQLTRLSEVIRFVSHKISLSYVNFLEEVMADKNSGNNGSKGQQGYGSSGGSNINNGTPVDQQGGTPSMDDIDDGDLPW